MKYYQPRETYHPSTTRFIFATGIECSYPTIRTAAGLRRIDQLEKCRHYDRWQEDLQLVNDLDIRFLRYGPPYYRIHQGPGRFDWSFTDQVLPEMRRRAIVPILDLCHFGVPDWIGSFQNPEFPEHFADYARAFARRYPWIWCYTPVNEMYITAEFSAFRGWWNERLTSHQAFVTAIKHLAGACLQAMLAIIQVRSDAIFVLAESSEHTHVLLPQLAEEAEFYNERRFLSLDLVCGRRLGSGMYDYIMDNGMTREELGRFMRYDLREHFIMGHDYYATNEHRLEEDGSREPAGDVLGYYTVAHHYHGRYGLPVMLTETNARGGDEDAWLHQTWANIQELRRVGMPLCGMTWYSLTDQVDWDVALREENNRVYPVGLYDLDRKIKPAGRAYRKLAQDWGHLALVPNGPLTLVGQWGRPADSDQAPAGPVS
jgi:beta-glucosidase